VNQAVHRVVHIIAQARGKKQQKHAPIQLRRRRDEDGSEQDEDEACDRLETRREKLCHIAVSNRLAFFRSLVLRLVCRPVALWWM
jgi:hypothetical protein